MNHDEQQLKSIMDEHPALHDGGYGGEPNVCNQKNRDALHGSVESFAVARQWVADNLRPIRGINRRRTSYGMKHIAEREIGYITNGVFIAAMLANGYWMGANPRYNPAFNVSEISVKRASALAPRRSIV